MPTAIPELAAQMNDTEDIERARSAKRDLWKLVRHAGRPGADDERGSLTAKLADLLRNDPSTVVGREVLDHGDVRPEIPGEHELEPGAQPRPCPHERAHAVALREQAVVQAQAAAIQVELQEAGVDARIEGDRVGAHP